MTPEHDAVCLDQLISARIRLAKAEELLRRCNKGFGGFIMGRKLARKEREKLRADINDFLPYIAQGQQNE